MLHEGGSTFVEVHEDAVPAEDVTAAGHLGRLEIGLKADCAVQFLLRVVDNLSDFVPLLSFYSPEGGQRFELFLG